MKSLENQIITVEPLTSTESFYKKYGVDIQILLVAATYFLSARLGYSLAFSDTVLLPAWPPSGIGMALILLLGRKVWPGITIGALITNLLAFWNRPDMDPNVIILISSTIAIGHTLEALLGNFLIKRFIQLNKIFAETKNTIRFLFFTLASCTVGALIGTSMIFIQGIIHPQLYVEYLMSWLVGNSVGILLFTPLLLSFRYSWEKMHFTWEKLGEIGAFLLLLTLFGLVFQVDYLQTTFEKSLPFLAVPLLLWLAFRFPLTIAMFGALGVSILALLLTTLDLGPFLLNSSYESMLLLQIFIGVISISTLIISSTVKERSIAQQELLEFNENLEQKVEERTKELEDEIKTRRKTEEKLKKINSELRKTNTELDNFVYSVSHDLRAPLSSILGLINLARKDQDGAEKDIYLDMIHKSALQQDNYIKEILDQSKNARLELQKDKVSFQQLADEVIAQQGISIQGKEVKKILKIDQTEAFITDSWRIKVIFNNLISNAIRYRNGKDPVVEISGKVENGKALLSVKDNGRGIEPQHLDHIFKMFYRATDDNAGSGLGLYIVKEAIDKLKGNIKVESAPGKGTTVHLEIPELN